MNILYLCDEYPPGLHGGIGTSVRLLAREMVKAGHQVVVAGLYSPGYGGEDEFDDQGVRVYRFRWGFDGKWFENKHSLAVRIGSRILKDSGLMQWDIKRSLDSYKQELEKLISAYKIDIIEMPDYNDYVRFCKSYTPFPGLPAPVVVKMHGSITYVRGGPQNVPNYIVRMEKDTLNNAAAVAGVSNYMAKKSAGYFSYKKEIRVLYNGINTFIGEEEIHRNPKQVIYTGALVEGKGIYQLAKAWNIVNNAMPEASLLILGRGSQAKVAAHLTIEAKKTVTFAGFLPAEKLYNSLRASAISVFPSYSEAFALAPMEAMVCGTAVINSNRTSGPELIDDKVNGLLIDPDDVDEIASAILYLLDSPEACATLAKKGYEKVKEKFEISRIAAQNIQFYEEILARIALIGSNS